MDEVHASPLGDPKPCRYMAYSADARLVDAFDRRLDAISTRHATVLDSVAETEANRGALFDRLRSGIYWCGGPSWWTSSPALSQNALQYSSWMVSSLSPPSSTQPPAASANAWQLYQRAQRDRNHAIEAATESAVGHYARALDLANALSSSAVLQRAAQSYCSIESITAVDAMRAAVERTTSIRVSRRLRLADITAIARGLAVDRTARMTFDVPPLPLPP